MNALNTVSSTLDKSSQYLCFTIAGQIFAIPITLVRYVFKVSEITIAPLAHECIVGILNFHGRIITAITLQSIIQSSNVGVKNISCARSIDKYNLAISFMYYQEMYCLMIEEIGDVIDIDFNDIESNTANMNQNIANISYGVYQSYDKIVIILDVNRIIANIIASGNKMH